MFEGNQLPIIHAGRCFIDNARKRSVIFFQERAPGSWLDLPFESALPSIYDGLIWIGSVRASAL